MKIRVVLCLALLAGAIVLLLNQTPRPSPTADAPAAEVNKTEPVSSGAALSSVAATAPQPAPPLRESALPPSFEALWEKPVGEPPFAAFKDWAARYQQATTDEAKAALEADGAALARVRLTAMADLIQSNPERALELAVPPGVRDMLPPSVISLVEEAINARGDLEVMGVLPVPGSGDPVTPVIRAAVVGRKRYEVFTFGKGLEFVTRQNVPLNGIAVPATASSQPLRRSVLRREAYLMALGEPTRLVTERSRLARALASKPVCPTSGEQTTVAGEQGGVIETFCGPAHLKQWAAAGNGELTTPAGAEGLPTAESSYTEGRKRMLLMRPIWSDYTGGMTTNDALTHFQNFSNYMYEMSQGKLQLAPLGKGSAITPPMLLPGVVADYDDTGLGALYNNSRTAASTTYGYDLAQFDFTYVCTGGRPAAGYAGLAFVGGVGFHLANSYWDSAVSVHEFGHNLGLNHAHFWDTGARSIIGSGQNVEYGDNNDPMGGGGSPNAYNSRYKNYLGWIRDTDVVDLNIAGSGLYRLYAFDLDNSVGLRGLKFARDGSQNYWLNFRQRKTNKKSLMNGAQLLWTGNGNQGSYLLDVRLKGNADDNAIVIGRTFSDVAEGYHVTPIGKGRTFPESLDVRVNIGSFPGNLPPVAVVTATPPEGGTGGQAYTLNATASDPNGDALAYYWDFGDGDYSVDNSATTTHTFPATAEFPVQCTVSDMKGGTYRRTVVVRVGSPATFRISGRVLDQQNRPLGGMRVTSSGKTVYTDSDGSYTVVGLSAGSHNLEVIEPVSGSMSFVHPSFNTPVTVGPNFNGADFIGVPGTLDIYTPLVARAAAGWRFLDDGSNQGTAWTQTGFIDSAWGTGTAPLGYPTGSPINTVISFGADSANKHITYYFRRQFTVPNPDIYTNVVLESLRDDSIAVYLNGSEIFRDNLITNANYLTRATDNSGADAYQQTPVNRTLLQPGVNYLAAEVHQVLPSSSDVVFDAALSGLNVSNVTGFKFLYIASPSDGSFLTTSDLVTVSATAFSGAAPVTLVEFYVDGAKFGEDANAPFAAVWSGPSVGLHRLTAVATLSGAGQMTSAPVALNIVIPPMGTVRIISPTNGESFELPATVAVSAFTAVSAANPGAVTNVQFFADGVLFGSDAGAPFSATLSAVTPGTRQLVAVSRNTLGISLTSAPVNIAIARPSVGPQLISFGDVWKYLDDGSNQGSAWTARNFDDRSWMAGPARLGYGSDGEITTVSSGTNANQRHITTYFRRSFVVANPASFSGLLLRLIRDDGAVVHLNGVEVLRDNLQAGAVSWNSLAIATINAPGETTPIEITLGTDGLIAGTNVLAVEVHQAAANSSDLGFDLSLEGLGSTPPSAEIYLTEPAEGAHFNAPAHVVLSAYAADGAGVPPVSVAYYADGIFVGAGSAESPFSQVWSNAPAGNRVLQAIGDWGAGVVRTSAPVSVAVGPTPERIQPLTATFVQLNTSWRYWDNVAPVAGGWQNPGFNDAAWPLGLARLGWGLDGEVTPLTPGRVTHYFRRSFAFASPATFTELNFSLARDDGAVVYLNGNEIFRSNIADGEVTPATLASTSINTPDETAYVNWVMNTAGSGLQSTGNVIAVELHQSSTSSSDGGFELQMVAYGTTEPRVYLASPFEGSTYAGSSNVVNFEAFARGNGGAAVSKVEFFANGAKLGEQESAPWRLAWSNAPVGVYALTARSTDINGLSLDSSPLQISVGREPVATTFITSNSTWRYLDTGANAGTAWAGTNFSDASWKSGQTRLGYGGDGETLPAVNYGPSASGKYITTYFRRKFVVPTGAVYTNLTFKLVRDDGAVVWLNGRELYRSNLPLPPIPIGYLTNALGAVANADEQTFFVTSLAATNLLPGTNVLGVEIHQSAPDSSDLGFNLELTGRGYSDDSTPPLLAIVMDDGMVELSWPSTATGWRLYTALSLDTLPSEWLLVVAQPLEVSGRFFVTLGPGFATQFFRLGRP